MTPTIAPLYAGIAGLGFLALSLLAIRARKRAGVMLGTGGDPALERAVRVHGNFAEYVPLIMVLMLAAEAAGAPRWALHLSGVAMLLGRLLHALAVGRAAPGLGLRVAAMALTFLALGALSLAAIASASG